MSDNFAQDDPLYLDLPPPSDRRITELHVWLATHSDGGQGIISTDMSLPDDLGTRHMPLMSSNRDIAEAMQPMAVCFQEEAERQGARLVSVRLASFRLIPAN